MRGILQDATDVLRMNEQGLEEEYFAKLSRKIAKLNAALEMIEAVGMAA